MSYSSVPNAVDVLRRITLDSLNHQIIIAEYDLKQYKADGDRDSELMCKSHINKLKNDYKELEQAWVPES